MVIEAHIAGASVGNIVRRALSPLRTLSTWHATLTASSSQSTDVASLWSSPGRRTEPAEGMRRRETRSGVGLGRTSSPDAASLYSRAALGRSLMQPAPVFLSHLAATIMIIC